MIRRENLDALIWVPDSPMTDTIIRRVAEAKPRSLIIVASLVRGQYYAHRPQGISLGRRPLLDVFRILPWNRVRLSYLLYPVFLLLSYPVMLAFYGWIGIRFRVNSVLVFDHQQAAVVGLLRRLGLFRRTVFFAGDWYPGSTFRKGIWTWLGNEVYFPIMDWIACRCNDLTINQTEAVARGRAQYWGRQIPRAQVGFEPPLILKCMDAEARLKGRKILFLGVTRPDSGLDLILEALPRVRERLGDVSLKVVGPITPTLEELRKTADKAGHGAFLECVGLGDYAAFETLFADCYCGANLIHDPTSYSSRALPAKILDYLQSLLPVLASPFVGPVADTVHRHELGLIVTPEADAVASGLIELHEKREAFVGNIRRFILNRTATDFVQLLFPE
jgi:glycosyltransferase involved in cell wall biosynthesis